MILYEGEWFNDKFDGYGKYISKDGSYYEGQFKNGLRHGKGKLICNEIILFEAIFNNDEITFYI